MSKHTEEREHTSAIQMTYLVTLVFVLVSTPSWGFEAFDCLAQDTFTIAYDGREPGICPEPKESYLPPC